MCVCFKRLCLVQRFTVTLHGLQELLNQSGHYSEKVRKGALAGLSELLLRHPDELRRQASSVLERLVERITDPDKAVRAALRPLLADRLLPLLGAAKLGPFLSLIMVHICSALTALTNDIR